MWSENDITAYMRIILVLENQIRKSVKDKSEHATLWTRSVLRLVLHSKSLRGVQKSGE